MINWTPILIELSNLTKNHLKGKLVGDGEGIQRRYDVLLKPDFIYQDGIGSYLWCNYLYNLIERALEEAKHPLSLPKTVLLTPVIAYVEIPYLRIAVHNEKKKGMMLGIETVS